MKLAGRWLNNRHDLIEPECLRLDLVKRRSSLSILAFQIEPQNSVHIFQCGRTRLSHLSYQLRQGDPLLVRRGA